MLGLLLSSSSPLVIIINIIIVIISIIIIISSSSSSSMMSMISNTIMIMMMIIIKSVAKTKEMVQVMSAPTGCAPEDGACARMPIGGSALRVGMCSYILLHRKLHTLS